jgi:hypothetical protein
MGRDRRPAPGPSRRRSRPRPATARPDRWVTPARRSRPPPAPAHRRRPPGRRSWPTARIRRRCRRRASSCSCVRAACGRHAGGGRRQVGRRRLPIMVVAAAPESIAVPSVRAAGTPDDRCRPSDMMRGRWSLSAFPLYRAHLSGCLRSSRDCAGSPTTCGGAGTRGRGLSSAASTAWPGPATATRSRSCRSRSPGRSCSTTRRSWPSAARSWPSSTLHGRRQGALVQPRVRRRAQGPIAYFCAEYGFHESARHLLRRPGRPGRRPHQDGQRHGPAVRRRGLLYKHGYFRQTIDADGHQEHAYPDYDLTRLPILRVVGSGRRSAHGPPRAARADARRRGVVRPGRSRPGAPARHGHPRQRRVGPADHPHPVRPRPRDAPPPGAGPGRRRRAGHQGPRHRAGGLAPQRGPLGVPARGADPRARRKGSGAGRGPRERVRANSVFTIHTPVSAGNERFDADLVRRVAGPLYDGDGRKGTGGVPIERVLELARGVDGDQRQFDMTALSLRLSNGANAVSKLHSVTANGTWQGLGDKQILAVTNGVHIPTWVGQPDGRPVRALSRRPARQPRRPPGRSRFWERTDQIPDVELWSAHQRQKLELASSPATACAPVRPPRRGARRPRGARVGPRSGALTIGFARRFATYKRAGLIFTDMDRISRLLWNKTARSRSSSPARPTRPTGPARA